MSSPALLRGTHTQGVSWISAKQYSICKKTWLNSVPLLVAAHFPLSSSWSRLQQNASLIFLILTCCFFFNFCWSIVALQCCVNFCCTGKWNQLYIYTYISPLVWISFPLGSPQSTGLSSIQEVLISYLYTVILSIVSVVCICQSQPPNSSHQPLHFPDSSSDHLVLMGAFPWPWPRLSTVLPVFVLELREVGSKASLASIIYIFQTISYALAMFLKTLLPSPNIMVFLGILLAFILREWSWTGKQKSKGHQAESWPHTSWVGGVKTQFPDSQGFLTTCSRLLQWSSSTVCIYGGFSFPLSSCFSLEGADLW